MLRRQFLIGTAALAVTGCTGTGGETTTISGVIEELKKQCQFTTEWETIARVITTLISGFDANAGAATTIAVAVAKQVVDMICNAVKQQVAQQKAEKKALSGKIRVIVNGVEVEGTYDAK